MRMIWRLPSSTRGSSSLRAMWFMQKCEQYLYVTTNIYNTIHMNAHVKWSTGGLRIAWRLITQNFL